MLTFLRTMPIRPFLPPSSRNFTAALHWLSLFAPVPFQEPTRRAIAVIAPVAAAPPRLRTCNSGATSARERQHRAVCATPQRRL